MGVAEAPKIAVYQSQTAINKNFPDRSIFSVLPNSTQACYRPEYKKKEQGPNDKLVIINLHY